MSESVSFFLPMSLNSFDLFELPYGGVIFVVLLIVVLMVGLTTARIANRHLNPESAVLDKRPIGAFERWLERLLLMRSVQLVLFVLFMGMFPVTAIGTRASWEAEFRALDSGQITELKTHYLLALMYRVFGLKGAIFAIRFITVALAFIAVVVISQRVIKFRAERHAELSSKNTGTSKGWT